MAKIEVEKFLSTLKWSDFFIEHIYTRGGCYQLYKVLKVIFPEAVPYFDGAHVATLIDSKLWDINGIVKDDCNNFRAMTEEQEKEAEKWSFAANNDLYYGECPICEEPIRIDRSKLIKQV